MVLYYTLLKGMDNLMSVAELRNKRNNLKTKTDAIFDNMQIIID